MAFPAVLVRSPALPGVVLDWFQSSGWRPSRQEPPMGFAGGHGYFETPRQSVLHLGGFVLSGEADGSAVVFWAIPKRLRTSSAMAELEELSRSFPGGTATKYPGFRQTKGNLKFFVPG